MHPRSEDEDKSQFKMFQTIALSVAVAVAYIIAVLGLMFYCKQRRKNKRQQKNRAGEEPEMEHLNGTVHKKTAIHCLTCIIAENNICIFVLDVNGATDFVVYFV